VFELLHAARPVLLEFGGPALDAAAWSGRVRHVQANYDAAWELPVLGTVTAPTAVLLRPDGYVAWVGEDSADGLAEALATWCGAGAS
jgi:3-(3-hydroxy-phenyl)propionate hydroxylase